MFPQIRAMAAIRVANDSPNRLGGSVWSSDIAAAKTVAIRMACGSVGINKHGPIQSNAPFGGVKLSGIGVEFAEKNPAEYIDIQVMLSYSSRSSASVFDR